jgi:hypothetical protein
MICRDPLGNNAIQNEALGWHVHEIPMRALYQQVALLHHGARPRSSSCSWMDDTVDTRCTV